MKWISVENHKSDLGEVLAMNNRNDCIVGYIHFDGKSWICENEHELLEDVIYYITVKELIKTLPNK